MAATDRRRTPWLASAGGQNRVLPAESAPSSEARGRRAASATRLLSFKETRHPHARAKLTAGQPAFAIVPTSNTPADSHCRPRLDLETKIAVTERWPVEVFGVPGVGGARVGRLDGHASDGTVGQFTQ